MMDKEYRSGVPSLFPLDVTFLTVKYGYGFKKFSPLFEIINEMIGRFLDHGLLAKKFKKIFQPKESDDIGPQILTMDQLKLCFIACLIPLGVAIFVFLIEILVGTTRKLLLKRN